MNEPTRTLHTGLKAGVFPLPLPYTCKILPSIPQSHQLDMDDFLKLQYTHWE